MGCCYLDPFRTSDQDIYPVDSLEGFLMCSSRGSLPDLSWVLVMITQSNKVENRVKELFAKENRNNF